MTARHSDQLAAQLTNIARHPNGNAVQRRDVVGRNLAQSPFWKRVCEDYSVRQVIFEVKNYKDIDLTSFVKWPAT